MIAPVLSSHKFVNLMAAPVRIPAAFALRHCRGRVSGTPILVCLARQSLPGFGSVPPCETTCPAGFAGSGDNRHESGCFPSDLCKLMPITGILDLSGCASVLSRQAVVLQMQNRQRV